MRSSGVVVFLSIAALSLGTLAAPGPAVQADRASSEGDALTDDYVPFEKIDIETAKRHIRLTSAAGDLQASLAERYPDHFAGLWIEREPEFLIAIGVTAADEGLSADANKSLGASFVTRLRQYSLAELEAAQASLTGLPGEYTTSLDLPGNRVQIDVESANWQPVADAVSAQRRAGLVDVRIVAGMPRPVLEIYGGLNMDVGACGVGLQGTSAFSVVKTTVPTLSGSTRPVT